MINLRQFQVFKAIMETGSVTAASERLQISPPAAIEQLKLLEDAVGLSLFERTGYRLIEILLDRSGVTPVRRGVRVAIIDLLTALDHAEKGITWRRFSPSQIFEIVSMRPLRKSAGALVG